jgi:two-component sensor histidine kinase
MMQAVERGAAETGGAAVPVRWWARLGPRLNGLQARMALIMGAVLVPAFAYSVWQAVIAYETHNLRLLETIRSTAELVSAYETEFFERTRGLIEELAHEPDVLAVTEQGCSSVVRDFLSRWQDYSSVVTVDASGVVLCATSPTGIGADVVERTWFQRLRRGEEVFAISERLTTLPSGEQTIIAATALGDAASGAFGGALAVTVGLRPLAPGNRIGSLPENSVILLLDGNEVPVLHRGNDREGQERGMPVSLEAAANPGGFVAAGQDGVERLYVVSDIAWGRLKVLIGVPVNRRLPWLREELVIGVFAPTLMLVLALVGIWIATNRLVNRHVSRLALTARAYRAGRLDARPQLDGAPAELAELGRAFAGMADRIAERESELKASLAQKDALLREIHHRVKNNLQVVASLLNLRLRGIRAPDARRVLADVQTRIKALALVHRNLYEMDQVGSVELQRFLGELGQLVIDSAEPPAGRVVLEVHVEPTRLPTDKAMAVALLVTECVTNALKHAFTDGRDGVIRVSLENHGDRARLTIADNGVGFTREKEAGDAGGDGACPGTLGWTLCRLLAKQIGGQITVSEPPGTAVSVTFNLG